MDRLLAAAVGHQRVGGVGDGDLLREDDPLVAERQAERRLRRDVPRDRVDGALEPTEALREAADPAAGRERPHERHVRRHDEPRADQQLAQRPAWEQAGVRGQVAPPAPPGEPRGGRRRVGRDDAQDAAGTQQVRAARDGADRVVHVFDDVREDDHVEAGVVVEVLERDLVHVEAERVARVQRRLARELDAHDVVPGRPRLVEQQPGPAADVEEPSRGHVLGDELEEAARGRATAGLLGQVRAVARLAVQRVQLLAGRQRRLLDGAALVADEEIPVQAQLVARGRERVRPDGSPRTRQEEPQLTGADAAAEPGSHKARHGISGRRAQRSRGPGRWCRR